MAKIVDDAIGRLPESIQRELNDAWASGQSSPYTRVVDPLNATLLHRAQTIRGMQAEVAALKAQRDELLDGFAKLLDAADDSDGGFYGTLSTRFVRGIAAPLFNKHKEASHG